MNFNKFSNSRSSEPFFWCSDRNPFLVLKLEGRIYQPISSKISSKIINVFAMSRIYSTGAIGYTGTRQLTSPKRPN